MSRRALNSHQECGRKFRNLIIRNCRYVEDLNPTRVDSALKIVEQGFTKVDLCIIEFLSSAFLPNIFAAKGQLARKHSLQLILQDKCLRHNPQGLEHVLEFASGMLDGADDLYGAFLNESPSAYEYTDEPDLRNQEYASVYSKHGSNDSEEFTLKLDDQNIMFDSSDELLLKITGAIREISDNEYKEWVTLTSRSNQEIWMMCCGYAGDMKLIYCWGDQKDVFATNMYEYVSVEKAVLTMFQYASGCEEWWVENNWFRQYI